MTPAPAQAALLDAHRRASCAETVDQVVGVLAESARTVLGAAAAVVTAWEPLSRDVLASRTSGAGGDAVGGLARSCSGLLDAVQGQRTLLRPGDDRLGDQVLALLGGPALLVLPLADARGDDLGVVVAAVDAAATGEATWDELRTTAESELGRALREQALQQRALYDAATGLPTGVLFEAALADALGTADGELAVLLVSVDQLQAVSRSFGRVVADELARKVAARLLVTASTGPASVARLPQGFAVLVHGQAGSAAARAAALVSALEEPWLVGRRSVRSTCRIGLAVARPGVTPGLLVEQAEAALAEAARRPRAGWVAYGAGLTEVAHEQLVLETLMQAALAAGEFSVRYQPQVEVASGRVTGAEALVRWHRPDGVVSPARFIPAAEASGVIVEIDRWVMGEAFRQSRRWRDDGLAGLRMAVNVSSRTLAVPGFAGTVVEAAASAGLHPGDVEVEVTETLELLEGEHAVQELALLRDHGMHVALDDFGTGYSNVGRLRRLPVDRVKIDQSFVRDIATGGDGEALCAAVIGLARTLDLDVIAEGVETREQLAVLEARGCREFQGYLTSPPVTADAFATLVG